MKNAILLVVLLPALLVCTSAFAEKGTWDFKSGGGMAFGSSGFMAASALDDQTLITIGIHQSSEFGIVYGWKSTNGGLSFDEILSATVSAEGCDMLDLFSFPTDGSFGDVSNGVAVGTGIPDSCKEEFDFPACLFACMFQMSAKVWVTHDGGDTWETMMIPDSLLQALTTVEMLDGDLGFAGGSPGLLYKTVNGGDDWTAITIDVPGWADASVNDINFIDETVGYMSTGYTPEEEAVKGDSYKQTYHKAMYMKNPYYRLAWLMNHTETKGDRPANSDGGIWKTVDGGDTWERLYQDYTQAVLRISCFDENHCVAVTDKVVNADGALNSVLYTVDGGENWEAATLPAALESSAGRYILSDIHMIGKKLVYAAGAGTSGFTYFSAMLYSEDGGKTWFEDNYDRSGGGFFGMGWLNGNKGFSVGMAMTCAAYSAENFAPIADAGIDLEKFVYDDVALNGSESYDNNGDPLAYNWVKSAGPDFDTANFDTTAEKPVFTPTEQGDYIFDLTVSDGQLTSAPDSVLVTVTEQDPNVDDDDDADDDDDDSGGGGSGGDDDDDETGACCG